MCHKILQRTVELVHTDKQIDGRKERRGEAHSSLKLTRRG
jgi:hypothetical protein